MLFVGLFFVLLVVCFIVSFISIYAIVVFFFFFEGIYKHLLFSNFLLRQHFSLHYNMKKGERNQWFISYEFYKCLKFLETNYYIPFIMCIVGYALHLSNLNVILMNLKTKIWFFKKIYFRYPNSNGKVEICKVKN
jgi:hypothetical protein